MAHIRSGPREEIVHVVPGDLKPALFQEPGSPPDQRVLALGRKFRDIAGCPDRLVEAAPLVDLPLGEDDDRVVRDVFHIVGKKLAAALEEPAVLHADEPVLCEERHRLREVDDIRFLCFIPLVEGPVHRV